STSHASSARTAAGLKLLSNILHAASGDCIEPNDLLSFNQSLAMSRLRTSQHSRHRTTLSAADEGLSTKQEDRSPPYKSFVKYIGDFAGHCHAAVSPLPRPTPTPFSSHPPASDETIALRPRGARKVAQHRKRAISIHVAHPRKSPNPPLAPDFPRQPIVGCTAA